MLPEEVRMLDNRCDKNIRARYWKDEFVSGQYRFFMYSQWYTNPASGATKEDFIKALHIDISLNYKGLDKIIDDLTKDNLIDYNEFLKIINK